MPKLFKRLPKAPLRQYLSKNLDCSDLEGLIRIYEELLTRSLPTVKSVRRWMEDAREILVALGEYESMAYINKSVNTRNKKAQADYLRIIQRIQPGLASYQDQFNKKLLGHPLRYAFPKRWKLMLRARQNAVDLFQEKNIPLERKNNETALKYSQLMGGLEVRFDGKRRTLAQMGVYLERTDRSLRQRAWESSAMRRYQEKKRIDHIYDRLIRLRTQIAKNAGFSNFRDYCHQKYDRFDYTPKHCFAFHDSVEEIVVPAVNRLHQRRMREMNLEKLKPWDLAVDPLGRPPLKPFKNGKELAQKVGSIFKRIDPELSSQFQSLIRYGLLDLDNRSGKEPGGYQCSLEEHQLPFIFMNAVGRDTDVRTLLHESGHAFHMLATRNEPILDYRHAPIEFCEVASMSMELLGNQKMSVFYPKDEDLQRSTQVLFEGILEVLPWIAMIDAFQHWIYTHPNHAHQERYSAWLKLRKRFGDGVDWSERRHFEEILWQRQLHLFGNPFYYIEYGIAQMGALMVWRRSFKNPSVALSAYKRALKLGGSIGLKQLFRTIGGKLSFGTRMMKPLIEAMMTQLEF